MADNLLFLEDRHIRSMLEDPRFAVIPCVDEMRRSLNSKLPECGKCQAKKKRAYAAVIASTKNCLTSLRGAQLAQVKTLLGARKLRVLKTRSNGKGRVQVTF